MNNDMQELLERGKDFLGAELSTKEREELAVYKQLFTMLEKEPVVYFPPGFPEKLVNKVRAKQDAKKEMLPNLLFIILIGAFLFYLPVIITGDSINAVTATFYEYKWICIFIVQLFILIYFISHTLKHSKSQ